MSRKSKSFSQLYDYLMRDENSFCFTRNTYSSPRDKRKLVREFMTNSDFLKTARGKNYLYHELLSLEENNLSLEKQKEILIDLATKYLKLRASKHLAFAVIHEDKNNLHLHLMLSSNEIEAERRVRLSKKELASIQATIEHYKNQKYIELSKSSFYQSKKDLSKTKQKEQEIKHKRDTKTTKQQIKEDLQNTFKTATSKNYLDNHLKNLGYEIYKRGKSVGVSFKNKNYRFKTLGLDKEYESLLRKLEKIKAREQRRAKTKEDRNFER